MASVWVYAEVSETGVDPSALELLAKARSMGGDETSAIALGPGSSEAAPLLGRHGAATVYYSDDSVYGDFVAEPAAFALNELVSEHRPELILFATNYDSRDVAGRLSAASGATLVSNVVDVLDVDLARTAFAASTQVDTKLEGATKLVLVRPKTFVAEESGGECNTIILDIEVPSEIRRARIVERHEAKAAGPTLQDASVVIAGGRGLQGPENFGLLDELADVIPGAAVGGTRAVVDAGWVPYSYQIGQTGSTVKPEVYMAFGISGATQHIVGMKGAKKIVAVNRDEDAPIFALADLGVVGNALELLPKLIEEIREG